MMDDAEGQQQDATERPAHKRDPGLGVGLAVCALAFAILASPWLSGRVTIPWDAKSQFYPELRFLADALHRGDSPFWAPNLYAGWPQIADPQSLIFSPIHFALAWFEASPSFRAADAATFATLALGALGIILFFRERGWHMAGATVAALAFAFGGSCASRLQHTGQILSLAYLPLALFLLGRALDRRSVRWGVVAGTAIGLIALGRDQVALLGLYVIAAFALAQAWRCGMRGALAPLVAAGVIAVAIAIVPVIMTELLAQASNRPQIDFASAGRGSLHPVHLLTLAFADLFGANDPTVDYWAPPSFAWKAAWGASDLFIAQNVGQLYAGALPLVAAIAALLSGAAWRREIRFFTLTAAVAAFYALGWHTPVFRALYEVVPGVSMFRRPADATFVFNLGFAMLAGYGVHWWLAERHAWQGARSIVAGLLAIATVLIAIAVALSVGKTDVALLPLLTGIGFAASAVAALILARRLNKRQPMTALVVLVAVLTLDLAWNNGPNESTGLPPATYAALAPDTTNETVRFIRERTAAEAARGLRERVEVSAVAYHWPNFGLAQGFDGLFGQNPLRLDAFARATGIGDTVAIPEQRTFAPLFPSYRSALANLFGLRLIVTGVPAERLDGSLGPADLTLVARTPDAFIYENPRALPRAMFLTQWRQADFAALLTSGWPDIDPAKAILLEEDPGFPTDGARGAGSAHLVHYANTEVVVEAESAKRGLLLLNDVWHPWWRATLDGAPARILKANVLFRAVVVPPGRHVVRFTFAPFAGAWRQVVEKVSAASP